MWFLWEHLVSVSQKWYKLHHAVSNKQKKETTSGSLSPNTATIRHHTETEVFVLHCWFCSWLLSIQQASHLLQGRCGPQGQACFIQHSLPRSRYNDITISLTDSTGMFPSRTVNKLGRTSCVWVLTDRHCYDWGRISLSTSVHHQPTL